MTVRHLLEDPWQEVYRFSRSYEHAGLPKETGLAMKHERHEHKVQRQYILNHELESTRATEEGIDGTVVNP
jgi:hypothetical protein